MLSHKPVLVREVLNAFGCLKKGSIISDCTLGMGGHTREFLINGYRVIGIDRDENALDKAKDNLKEFGNISYARNNFIDLRKILDGLNIKAVDGILVDLGVSTYQLEDDSRGFGFTGRLDMRMDTLQELTAEKIVNEYAEDRISNLLFENGERAFARKIARRIVETRKIKRIENAEELLEIIKRCMPPRYRFSRKHHWATPTFRALRIEVNNDIGNLKSFLDSFLECLNKEGIISIISFHSIEDRIVKHKFKELAKLGKIKILTKKPIESSESEIKENPKELRAKMRVAKKV